MKDETFARKFEARYAALRVIDEMLRMIAEADASDLLWRTETALREDRRRITAYLNENSDRYDETPSQVRRNALRRDAPDAQR